MSLNDEYNSPYSDSTRTDQLIKPPHLSTPPHEPGGKSCLYLSNDVIRFEAVSELTAVFFDESNSQLIISRSNGAGGIIVKCKKDNNVFNLRLQNTGDIRSLNFSTDSRILAIKRSSSKSIDFANVVPGCETKEFSQMSKLKSSKIVGICWVNSDEVAMVSDKGVEYYQVFPEKRTLKLLKSIALDIHWYLWMAESGLCMLSTGSLANVFYGLHFKDNTFSKMAKMEIDVVTSQLQQPRVLKQKEFMLIKVYNTTYMTRTVVEKVNCLVEVHLYPIRKDSKKDAAEVLLLLNCSGRVVLSVVDHLVVMHHHLSKTSHIFDIGLENFDIRGGVKFHLPIIPSLPIRPFKIQPSCNPHDMTRPEEEMICELYSSHWAIFSPDVILDAKEGCYWNLKVDLQAIVDLIEDKVHLVSILLLRKNSQSLILKVCHDLIKKIAGSSLVDLTPITEIFNKINKAHTSSEEKGLSSGDKVIGQMDVYDKVFLKLHQLPSFPEKYLNSVIIDYLLSLSNHSISAQEDINNLLLERLLLQQRTHQLQQMLQYRLFQDSKSLAIRLLSLSCVIPAANQLALDMLRRMSTSLECIFELLLSNKQVVSAIRYAQSLGLSDQLKARKFLEVSMTSQDDSLFYVVYHYFEEKNMKNRGSPKFVLGDQCETYVQYYNNTFS